MFVPIKLDKTRNFKYGYRGLDLIETELGEVVNKIFEKASKGELTIRETFTVIWAGLVHEDKELTVEKVMDLVDEFSDLDEVTNAMAKALEKSRAKGGSEPKNSKKIVSI